MKYYLGELYLTLYIDNFRQRTDPESCGASVVSDFGLRSTPSTQKASTVNFEKIQGRFEALKRQKKE